MARFRRRLRRRKPVRRVGRRARPRRWQRRRKTGTLYCKLTKITIYSIDNTKNDFLDLAVNPEDFTEYTSLAKNFEFCKFLKVKVTILPLQNVSNSSSSIMPCYAMTPWHYNIPIPNGFDKFLSMDKAKCFRGTQVGRQTYVPSVMVQTGQMPNTVPNPLTAPYLTTVHWRPEIRTVQSTGEKTPTIRTGAVCFQGSSEIVNKTSAYNIKWDVWVKFSGQTTMLL
ncbi:capsid protein [Dipodfec virus UA04Rod_5913]|uniref:Capsid protein n=1 Tax=Dipodfec virus UA04Rod_5913 TaxID=2929252 RepID=A0A976R8P9_9CIRC|nr:capsid protein [Dipodfec virus UA04Rod_5913]UPW41428.1 capsid protein [Dipodfec virus UA04Rod_5913]